ncbi:MAG: hypothetical protein ACC628_08655, partial [Pirellulaceae bacterium]
MVLFCQMDVTGRTEEDAAATRLVRNILSYISNTSYPVRPSRKALYAGDAAAFALCHSGCRSNWEVDPREWRFQCGCGRQRHPRSLALSSQGGLCARNNSHRSMEYSG